MNLRSLSVVVPLLALSAVSGCGGDSDNSLSTKEVFERARPATLEISGRRGDGYSGGTGVVIDAKQGLMLTNDHVMAGLHAVKARTYQDETVSVRLVGAAPCEDLALVRMRDLPKGITELKFGDSTKVENEDKVVALGFPTTLQGFEGNTIVSTNGTVSVPDAPALLGPSSPRYDSTIQHTATVNPGNSGGPLLNDSAELIGINTLSLGGSRLENQFYSITTKQVQRFLPDLKAGKKIDYAGWSLAALSDVDLAQLFEATGYGTQDQGRQAEQLLRENGIEGMFVWGATTGSPAEEAQITGGDLVTEIEDTPVRSAEEVCEVLASASPGDTLRVDGRYLLSGGQETNFGDRWSVRMKLQG